ncbi:MAG: F0F1 ATP synthase subunit epsilon [Rhodospirillales bacterium]|jgi:F-type H+-transporting ATPase subunit epsilon|nr:F0F1 ATP synthase subunit epsilon [Rhodospirillales bacterium]
MADTIEFELVSPERLLRSGPVEMVVVPGGDGDFGVLPEHAPLVSTVRAGAIVVYEGGRVKERIFVAGGFAEVTPERCTVLAEEAVPTDELNRVEAEERIREAKEILEEPENETQRMLAERDLAVAQSMLAFLDSETAKPR